MCDNCPIALRDFLLFLCFYNQGQVYENNYNTTFIEILYSRKYFLFEVARKSIIFKIITNLLFLCSQGFCGFSERS